MEQTTLKFGTMGWDNKGFLDGTNMTCRKGSYWDNKVIVGEIVSVATFDGEVLGEAIIIDKMLLPFINIPAWALEYQHEKTFQDYDSLYEGMVVAYGDSFDENEIVTLLFFAFLED